MSTKAEKLMKFGPVFPEIRCADFCRSVRKVTETPVCIAAQSAGEDYTASRSSATLRRRQG